MQVSYPIPIGYKAVDFRVPLDGEPCINCCGQLDEGSGDYPRLILEKFWVPPEWMKEGTFLFQYPGGEWTISDRTPLLGSIGWSCQKSATSATVEFLQRFSNIEFTPPECKDWRESLIEIHHQTYRI